MKVAIIGSGNISNSRHIPAIKKNKSLELIGVVSNNFDRITSTINKHGIQHFLHLQSEKTFESLKECKWFMDEVDAVVIGTPPKTHYFLVKACLNLGKHVLVEKPFTVTPEEGKELIALSREKNRILNVMHSFQFSNGITELDTLINNGKLGAIKSMFGIQLTNRRRRLPTWYNDLPLGLFYDEAAHFFYTSMRFGGDLVIDNASAVINSSENTPVHLQIQMHSAKIPVQIYMNFSSPICEWFFVVLGKDKIAIYDYFKDILVVLDNDDQHLAKNVLMTFLTFLIQFSLRFLINGIKMFTGTLLYGHDTAINNFVRNIDLMNQDDSLMGSDIGYRVVKAMYEVFEKVKDSK